MVQLFTMSFRMVVCYRGTVPTNMSFGDGVHQIEAAAPDNAIGGFLFGGSFFGGNAGITALAAGNLGNLSSTERLIFSFLQRLFSLPSILASALRTPCHFVSSCHHKFETLLCPKLQNSSYLSSSVPFDTGWSS